MKTNKSNGIRLWLVLFHCAWTHYSYCFVSLRKDTSYCFVSLCKDKLFLLFCFTVQGHYSFCFVSLYRDTLFLLFCLTVQGHTIPFVLLSLCKDTLFLLFVSLCKDTIPIVLFHCARTLFILFCFTVGRHMLAPFASTLFTSCISGGNKMNIYLLCLQCGLVYREESLQKCCYFVMWWLSQSPGWTSHGPMTRNSWVMSGTISHAGTHYSLM